jgi:hypothetical protein
MRFPRILRVSFAGMLALAGSACGRALPIPLFTLPDAATTPPDAGATPPDAARAMPDATLCARDVDLTRDPDNCGACGHSCGGGACVDSQCQPFAIATGQSAPNALTVDATSVYWTTSDGNVRKAPINGGQTTLLVSGQQDPWGIAVDATRVYWVNAMPSGQVLSAPISGGTPTVLADQQLRPFKLALNDGILYWTNNSGGAVMKLPVTGGSPIMLAARQGSPVAITTDGGRLYWSSLGQAAIRSLAIDGADAITTIATDQDAATLFVRDGIVYWANIELQGGHGTVFKLSPGGTPVALATSPSPVAAVSDGVTVYWSDDASNAIHSVPVAGGADRVVAADQAGPSEMAIDRDAIYWINAVTDGAIMKLAK